jgi:tryptophan-rich sensory protein
MFDPSGLAGLTYWYFIYPLHQIVFAGMLHSVVKAGPECVDANLRPWRPSPARQIVWLLGLIAICFGAAAAGAAMTSTSVNTWYQTLDKPSWTPPDWLFGPVWTVLYFLMALAAWLVWRRGGWHTSQIPLSLFGLQLMLNLAWSAIFFGMRSPGLAFGEILLLLLAIGATIISFWGRSVTAALLFLPYLAWTSFAAVLNFAIWTMNS